MCVQRMGRLTLVVLVPSIAFGGNVSDLWTEKPTPHPWLICSGWRVRQILSRAAHSRVPSVPLELPPTLRLVYLRGERDQPVGLGLCRVFDP